MFRSRIYLVATSLLVVSFGTPSAGAETKKLADLHIVDRSLSDDGLYYCTLRMPKDLPVEAIALVLYDRQRKKVGEALLGTIDTHQKEKIAPFRLNKGLVKFSVVELHVFPPSDDRHQRLRFVVGEHPARRRQNGKIVETPID